MKILQVCSHYVPAYRFGGPLRVAHNLGKALVRQGHEVTVVTTNLATENTVLDVAIDTPTDVDGVTVYYEPTRFSRYLGISPKMHRRIKQLIKWADVVFVHFHYQFANWAGAAIARKYNVPYIIFAHGSFNKWGVARRSTFKKKYYLKFIEGKNIRDSLFIAFNADEEKSLSMFKERGQVIPSGIAPDDFKDIPAAGCWRDKNELQDKTIFLFLGRLNLEQKGLDLLIPAFANIVKINPTSHLVLAGPDERGGRVDVEQMINQFGLQKHVTLTGMIDGPDKLALLNDADVFTLVSPSEGTSIALLEAMYMGLPVVVSDSIGFSQVIKNENCGIVIQRSVEELTRALQDMLNFESRQLMGDNAHSLIEKEYVWDNIASDLIVQLRELT